MPYRRSTKMHDFRRKRHRSSSPATESSSVVSRLLNDDDDTDFESSKPLSVILALVGFNLILSGASWGVGYALCGPSQNMHTCMWNHVSALTGFYAFTVLVMGGFTHLVERINGRRVFDHTKYQFAAWIMNLVLLTLTGVGVMITYFLHGKELPIDWPHFMRLDFQDTWLILMACVLGANFLIQTPAMIISFAVKQGTFSHCGGIITV